MSPRRFDGWEPQEVHEHFTVDDETGEHRPCRAADALYTVVTREAEWDDAARGQARHFVAHEKSIDKETGLPLSEAFTEQGFIVHSDAVNYAARAIAIVRSQDAEKHKDDEHWFDGRRYYASVPDPDA